MGKFVAYLSILIFIDLMLIITGQFLTFSPSSIIIQSIIDPSTITSGNLWVVLFGVLGIGGLAVLSGVSTGVVSRAGIDILAFTSVAATLALIIGDFIAILAYLVDLNPVLAIVIMAPMTILYGMTVAEWLRGKD